MKTEIVKVNPDNPAASLQEVSQALRAGEVVCFPTETVYGLGACWNDEKAVKKIFEIKGRPQDNPLIVHVAYPEEMKPFFAFWDEVAQALTAKFCPGPFTLIMPKSDLVNSPVTAGLNTIGIRVPVNPIAHALIDLTAVAIAAPSANISGRPSPTNVRDCYEDLHGKVRYIVDGGQSTVGLESTIVSWDGTDLKLLRPGGISVEAILACLQENGLKLELKDKTGIVLRGDEKPEAPGMKYRHYAPKAPVFIIKGNNYAEKYQYLMNWLESESLISQKQKQLKLGLYISRGFYDYLFEQISECSECFECSECSVSPKCPERSANLAEILSTNTMAAQDLNRHALKSTAIVKAAEYIIFTNDSENSAAARGLFTAFRELDRRACDVILAEELPDQGVGKAYMNRLRKASNG